MIGAQSLDIGALPDPVPLTLVLGGARSGKSRWGEALTLSHAVEATYIATAQAFDSEMEDRIAVHRLRRGPVWHTVEAPLALPAALARAGTDGLRPVLVDCLTLWLSNLILAERPPEPALDAFESVLSGTRAPVVVVSNEVGQGIVPETPLGRRFRDVQGFANQRLASRAQRVIYCVAGIGLAIKDVSVPPITDPEHLPPEHPSEDP